MVQTADANPGRFSYVSMPLDGSFIAFLAASPNILWDQAGQVLKAMTTAVRGGPAPKPVKDVVGSGPGGAPPPPAGAPAQVNDTAGLSYLCNEDTNSPKFQPLWAEYQR